VSGECADVVARHRIQVSEGVATSRGVVGYVESRWRVNGRRGGCSRPMGWLKELDGLRLTGARYKYKYTSLRADCEQRRQAWQRRIPGRIWLSIWDRRHNYGGVEMMARRAKQGLHSCAS
jgi:hypothetical protein